MKLRKLAGATALGVALAVLGSPLRAQDYDASRIVAIGGSVTEIIYALGEEERLIARDTTSVFPEAALELPDVGYIRQLSPEGVISVDPSLIIALEGSGPPEAVEVLEKASIPMVTVPDRYDREGILEKIRIVGDVLDVEDKAAALMAQAIAETIILDWENVADRNGDMMEYSPARAKQLLIDLPDLRQIIMEEASKASNFIAKEVEEGQDF